MEDLIKLFDSLLTILVSFPITMFHLLISPEKLVGLNPTALISPAGATLVISFIIWYFSRSMQAKIKYSFDLPFLPSKEYATRVFVFIIIVLIAQCLIVLIPSIIPTQPVDAVKIVRALSYPISLFLTINGVVYLVYLV